VKSLKCPLGEPDFTLGGLQLWIHGYEFPDTHYDYYDANWLYATVHYESASSSVWVVHDPMILTWELYDWLCKMERLYRELRGTATLDCLEPYLFVELKAEHRNCLLREVVKGAYNRRLLYQLRRQSLQLPPLRRFPPLREGNRARVRFPLRAGGTCRSLEG
jgi:hypothetical protein